MKILYITHYDSNDIKLLSGTIYHVRRMLEKQGYEVIVLDKIKYPRLYYNAMKAMEKITKKKTFVERSPKFLKYISMQIKKRTRGLEYDLVFSPSSLYFAYYKDTKPMVFYTDAAFGGMLEYYIPRKSCFLWAIQNAMDQEKKSLENVTLAIYASRWAVNTAVQFHNADPEKCTVVNRGANVRHSFSFNEIDTLISNRECARGNGVCKCMLLGTDFERKGGLIACEVVRILNEVYHVKASLDVIGSTPNIPLKYKLYVNVIGYLNKQIRKEYEQIENIFKSSDFFLMPTRREAQGISYAEACSWGVPVVATNTGGVSGIVSDTVNGILFEEQDEPMLYAKRMMNYISNPDKYRHLAESTYKYFYQKLSWDAVGKQIDDVLKDCSGIKKDV